MKILLITAHFPHYDMPGVTYATPFLADYAAEWVKQGHEVTLIHMERVYPSCFNLIAGIMSKLGIHRFEKYAVDRSAYSERQYCFKGIHISRYLYKKYVPHSSISMSQLNDCVRRICNDNILKEFEPDVVIGDCLDPVLPIIRKLNLSGCKVGQIVHAADFQYFDAKQIKQSCNIVDKWIIRSEPQRALLNQKIGEKSVVTMFSGIPQSVVEKEPRIRKKIEKLLYVGALYKTKGIETILRGMASCSANYQLTIVGKGPDEAYFREKVRDLNLSDRVAFVGPVPHEQVFSYMEEADCLALISHETFGMVYVEAMSQGCIPIGTIGEGIDGVVKNGENGFLTALNDESCLSTLLKKIKELDENEIGKLSKAAYLTAKEMTQERLATVLLEEMTKGNES